MVVKFIRTVCNYKCKCRELENLIKFQLRSKFATFGSSVSTRKLKCSSSAWLGNLSACLESENFSSNSSLEGPLGGKRAFR